MAYTPSSNVVTIRLEISVRTAMLFDTEKPKSRFQITSRNQ